jgi:acetylglutamate kinase
MSATAADHVLSARDIEVVQRKASVLIEALPWLKRFNKAVIVVKYGGHAMTDEALKRAFA